MSPPVNNPLNPALTERQFSFWLAALSQAFLLIFLAGFVGVLVALWSAAAWVNVYVSRASSLPKYRHGRRYHAWALVTGGSDGLGKATVNELAKQGFNVLVHGRNGDKLRAQTDALAQRFPGGQFRPLVIDAATSHGLKKAVEGAVESLADLPGPLTVLVNNIGGTIMLWPERFKPFAEHAWADVDACITLNSRFTVQLTRALLPKLIKGKPALILTAGSQAGLFSTPYTAVYAGTKAFLQRWAQSLALELRAEGYQIESLMVVYGITADTAAFKETPSFLKPSAETAARGALHKVGCGQWAVASCVGHWVGGFVMGWLPEWLAAIVLTRVGVDMRARELKALKAR